MVLFLHLPLLACLLKSEARRQAELVLKASMAPNDFFFNRQAGWLELHALGEKNIMAEEFYVV